MRNLPPAKTVVPQIRLTQANRPFKIAFERQLDNGYEIKDMTAERLKEFHRFIRDTVYKNLTISEVDKIYLRKEGLSNAPAIISKGRELLLQCG